jgi:hypothetical protein
MSKFFTRGMFPLHADVLVEGWRNPLDNSRFIRLEIKGGRDEIVDVSLHIDEAKQIRDALSDAIVAAGEEQQGSGVGKEAPGPLVT